MPETRPPDLRKYPFFSIMPEALLHSLQSCLLKWDLASGAVIVRRGERNDFMGIIGSGKIELEKENGEIQTIVDGDAFGEGMLRYGVPSAYTIRVVDPTDLWILWRSDWLAAKLDYDASVEGIKSPSTVKDRGKSGAPSIRKKRGLGLRHGIVPIILALVIYFLGPTIWAVTNRTLIDVALQMNRPDIAVDYLQFVLDWQINSPELHEALGYLLFNQGNLYGASEQFQQAVLQDDDLAVARNNLGVALIDQNRSKEAVIHLKAATELDPGNAIAYKNLGDAYLIEGNFEEASRAYQRAIDLDPGQQEARAHWAGIALKQGRVEDARQAWEQVVDANPRIAMAQRGLGVIAVLQDRPIEALLYLDAARLVDPSDAMTHVYLGVALEALNRPEEAIVQYTEALALNSDPDLATWVQKRLESINRSSPLSDASMKGGTNSIHH